MKLLSLFSGIGAFEKALKNIGIDYELVGFSEIDKWAIKSYCAIHNEDEDKNLGDIKEIDLNTLPKDIDIITHGSPCQDFSVAGKQAGGDLGTGTRSSLMWNTVDIIMKCKPKYVIWENVKNLLSQTHKHNFDNYINIMETLGYNSYYQVLNAKDYGIPQNRERVYTISIRKDIDKGDFKFPEKEPLKLRLKDVLEDNVDEKYYLKDWQINKIQNSNFMQEKKRIQDKDYCDTILARDWKDPKCVQVGNLKGGKWNKINENCRRVYSGDGISPTIHTCQGGNTEPKVLEEPYIVASRGRNPENPSDRKTGIHTEQRLEPNTFGTTNCISTVQKDNWLVNNYRIRKLTPKECWRLMGFLDEDFEKAKAIPTSNTQLYKQAGNSIVVNVLEKIFKNLFKGE